MSLTSQIQATKTAIIQKRPAMVDGIISGDFETHIASVKCTPLEPVSSEIQRSMGLDAPYSMKQVRVFGDYDIERGRHFLLLDGYRRSIAYVEEHPSRNPLFGMVMVVVVEITDNDAV